tara:strand:+ start:5792 stop:6859 length:1068 start_codon:yes stop_codon:yes gene_type:complete
MIARSQRRKSAKSMTWAGRILLALAAILLVATLVSLIGTNRGVIRVLDFVREPTIYLAALLAVLALFWARPRRLLVIGMLVATIAINLWRIWPYTFLAGSSVPMADAGEAMNCARVLSLNVLQSNDRYAQTASLIERSDPDILLLMETDQAWLDALEPQLARYDYTLTRPLDNRYGMAFATRLEVERAQMVDTIDADTPTLYATLRTDKGARFELVGLHPHPPLPGQSTASRDANIARAGAQTPEGLGNVLAIGDFNDVPWSSTTQAFMREGGYADPRAGRGSFATFPAPYVLLGWPLDQIFVKQGVTVESLTIGEDVGSDHRPLLARVCVDPMSTHGNLPDDAGIVPTPAQTAP